VIVTPIAVVDSARAAGTIYYMSASGSDGNPGTLAAPWKTFRHSLPALRPGDTLYVRGGTYSEVFDSSRLSLGSAQARITVAGYPSDPLPLFKGSLTFRGATYWTISRIRVTWNGSTPNTLPLVKFMNGIGWRFEYSEVWGGHGYGTVMVGSTVAGQPSNWSIVGNCIHHTYAADGEFQDHNLYVNGIDYGPGLIEKNLIFNAYNGDNIKIGGPTAPARGTGYVTVRYNSLYNAAQNVVVPWKSHHNVIDHNILGYAWGKSWYPNVRGFELTGTGNVASRNFGYKAAMLLRNDGTTAIKDGGGNKFGTDPKFNNVSSCSGFLPQNTAAQGYGRYGFTPIAGDWNADRTDSIGSVLGNVVSLRNSTTSGGADVSFTFGLASDRFISGDWNGDGRDTIGAVRGSTFYLRNTNSAGPSDITFQYGSSTDRLLVGDWNGNGTDGVGLVRGNTFYLRNMTGSSPPPFQYGLSTDRAIAGDWNGDGVDDIGLVRGNTFYLRNSTGPSPAAFQFGLSTDRVIVGDWDGNGTDTIGVIRGSTVYLRNSNSGGPSDIRFDLP
jgi:hypothetical protein